MRFLTGRRALFLVCILLVVATLYRDHAAVLAAPTQPNTISYWGMNSYFTKGDRPSRDNVDLLANMALDAGARWTREELPWDLFEPSQDRWSGTATQRYDARLKFVADKGFGIIGMLLTTPGWARDAACAGNYWCPPANVNDYAEWAGWMVERYDGDGNADALGSPRIAAWEIWNEPNDTVLWPDVPGSRQKRYGDMLVASYRAIKAADPTALVLIGGMYIYDGSCTGGVCDGLNFLNAAGGVFQQVPAARNAYDVFAIHPYIPTDRPDAPQIPPVITVEGRIRQTRNWLNDPRSGNRPDAPIWITEMGWCTEGGTCPGGVAVGEDAQANYLVRSMVIAQHNGVQHTSWFQLEDAFNDSQREWSNAAILRNYDGVTYPAKPAYLAYRTLARTLADAVPAGAGPVNQHRYNATPYAVRSDNNIYDYRYTSGSTVIDVIWHPTSSATVTFPAAAGKQLILIDRDSGQQSLTPSNGVVRLNVSERPILVVQQDATVTPPPDLPFDVYLPTVMR